MSKARIFWTLLALCISSLSTNLFLALRLNQTASDASDRARYVEYRPVFFDASGSGSIEDSYHVDTRALSAAHLDKVKIVMDLKKLHYRIEDGRLMIPAEIWGNKNLMREITSAAMNWYWLSFYAGYTGDRRGTWEDWSALAVKRHMEEGARPQVEMDD